MAKELCLESTPAFRCFLFQKQLFCRRKKRLFAFLWKNKTDKIKGLVLFRPLSKGGLNFRCFKTTVKALRISWISRLLSNSNDNWTAIPNHNFEKYGGLLFLLNCNYSIDKLVKKIPCFTENCSNIFKNCVVIIKIHWNVNLFKFVE